MFLNTMEIIKLELGFTVTLFRAEHGSQLVLK